MYFSDLVFTEVQRREGSGFEPPCGQAHVSMLSLCCVDFPAQFKHMLVRQTGDIIREHVCLCVCVSAVVHSTSHLTAGIVSRSQLSHPKQPEKRWMSLFVWIGSNLRRLQFIHSLKYFFPLKSPTVAKPKLLLYEKKGCTQSAHHDALPHFTKNTTESMKITFCMLLVSRVHTDLHSPRKPFTHMTHTHLCLQH